MTYQEMKVTIPGKYFQSFGRKVLISQIKFQTLQAIFEIDQEVQRKLDVKRKFEIRDFIIQTLEENDFYFSPFIFSSRGNIVETDGGGELSDGCKVYILDGQHRTAGLIAAITHLQGLQETAELMDNQMELRKVQAQIKKLKGYPISVQIYLDLDKQEEQQLFSDLNTKRKEPHLGLVMQYDQRDHYADITRQIASRLASKMEIEDKLSRISMSNSALTSLTIMRRCLLALFDGNLTVSTKRVKLGGLTNEEAVTIGTAFFETWLTIFPRNPANRKKFTSGYSGIQIALGLTAFLLHKHHKLTYEEALQQMEKLQIYCTWKHDDPHYPHIYDQQKKRINNHSRTTSMQKTAIAFCDSLEKERTW
ncbi:DNA sulfur modification protein DndB [Peribacillus sp. JNUCC 23]|uniref:DNA sulfur modification protein DndB n=1 Tax=Peribacillus sp. NPDC096379 TaxID=3364393 RepID=UPI003806FE98